MSDERCPDCGDDPHTEPCRQHETGGLSPLCRCPGRMPGAKTHNFSNNFLCAWCGEPLEKHDNVLPSLGDILERRPTGKESADE